MPTILLVTAGQRLARKIKFMLVQINQSIVLMERELAASIQIESIQQILWTTERGAHS